VSDARVEFSPEALREIDDAFEWYLERNLQAAEAFVREVDSAVALIANSPTVWPSFEAGTRRYVLRRFPYNIIYREIPVGIEVVAVAHHKRRPRYWCRRLRRH
jgi:plasmid stabilization system protein ParE